MKSLFGAIISLTDSTSALMLHDSTSRILGYFPNFRFICTSELFISTGDLQMLMEFEVWF